MTINKYEFPIKDIDNPYLEYFGKDKKEGIYLNFLNAKLVL